MTISVYTKENYKSFDDVIRYFAKYKLQSDTDNAKRFLHNLGDYLDDEDAPCDKILLQSFIYDRRFRVDFILKDVKICYVCININRHGIFEMTSYKYEVKEYENRLHSCVKEYLDMLNQDLLNKHIRSCNLTHDNKNEVAIVKYHDYKKSDKTSILKGTIEEIFDDYTSMNDTLRYCNGEYWDFENKSIDKLYCLFTSMQKDYFLLNAVKRGCLID